MNPIWYVRFIMMLDMYFKSNTVVKLKTFVQASFFTHILVNTYSSQSMCLNEGRTTA